MTEVRASTRVLISVVGTWDEFQDWCDANGLDPHMLGVTQDEVDALNEEASVNQA